MRNLGHGLLYPSRRGEPRLRRSRLSRQVLIGPGRLRRTRAIAEFGAFPMSAENRFAPAIIPRGFDAVVETKPELFVFLGDNIYADTQDMDVMRAKYKLLGDQPGFIQLKKTCPI